MNRRAKSVLVYALLILNISVTPVLPCTPLPGGQYITKRLKVTGFNLPAELVYGSSTRNAYIPSSKWAAKNAIDDVMKNAVDSVIRDQTSRFGWAAVTAVLDQVRLLSSEYEPLQCRDVRPAMPKFNYTIPYGTCYIVSSVVVAVCRDQRGCTDSNPPSKDLSDYTRYEGTIRVRNAEMAAFTDSRWDQMASSLKSEVGRSFLGKYFYSADFRIS
ncbi:hypothetical protein Q1695_011288 [Nippostrongylus brasiliensis]|nr:hypothetical protein Q1695_011288 [Nippostrongylus brasiliensis]